MLKSFKKHIAKIGTHLLIKKTVNTDFTKAPKYNLWLDKKPEPGLTVNLIMRKLGDRRSNRAAVSDSSHKTFEGIL